MKRAVIMTVHISFVAFLYSKFSLNLTLDNFWRCSHSLALNCLIDFGISTILCIFFTPWISEIVQSQLKFNIIWIHK